MTNLEGISATRSIFSSAHRCSSSERGRAWPLARLLVARLGTGIVVDRFPAPQVAAVIMVISALGFAGLAYGGVRFAAVGALACGIAFGAEGNLLGYMTARYFSAQAFGRIFGLLYAAYLAGTAVSPVLYGAAFDRFGNYDVVLAAAAMALVISAAAFLRLNGLSKDGAAVAAAAACRT